MKIINDQNTPDIGPRQILYPESIFWQGVDFVSMGLYEDVAILGIYSPLKCDRYRKSGA